MLQKGKKKLMTMERKRWKLLKRLTQLICVPVMMKKEENEEKKNQKNKLFVLVLKWGNNEKVMKSDPVVKVEPVLKLSPNPESKSDVLDDDEEAKEDE